MLLARRFCTPSLRTVVSKYATLSVQSPRRLWSSLLCNSLQRVYEGDVKPVNTICRPMLHNSCLRSGTRRGFVSEAPKVDGLSHSSAATKTDEENLSENELKELEALSQDASAFSATTDAYNPEEVDQLFGTAGTEPPPLQLPDIPITGTTPCRWVIEGDHGNPYRFDILDLTHVIAESDTSAVAHGNSPATEQSLEEVGESFQNLASSLFGPGGVLEGSDSPDNEFVKTNKQAGMSSRDAAAAGAAAQRAALEGRNRESFQQNTVLFEPPLVVRFPVPRALYQDIKQVFTTKLDETTSASSPSSSTSLSSSGNKGPPPMRTLQKARDSGGRYDVYLTGQEGRILFFASTACLANRSLLPDDGSVALERHHVVTLREQPRLVPVPAALMTSSTAAATTTTTTTTSMSSSVVSRDTQEADATIEAVLEFECTSVTSTFDRFVHVFSLFHYCASYKQIHLHDSIFCFYSF